MYSKTKCQGFPFLLPILLNRLGQHGPPLISFQSPLGSEEAPTVCGGLVGDLKSCLQW